MKILIQSATLLDKQSPFHKKKKNVLINNGRITEIGDKKFAADRVIQAAGMFLTTGWFDLGTYVGDPGHEQREDLTSLSATAASGGFTGLAVLPNTNPPIQSKNGVAYLESGNSDRLVQMHALASVTLNNKGEELTEMIDLHEAGAVGFTDGLKPIWHSDIYLKALQYLQKFNGVLIDHPEDVWLSMYGQMHEGVNSTRLGLKGIPRIAEELPLGRNIELLNYGGGKAHFSRLSTAKSIDLVRAAQKRGLKVTCDITGYQALLDDSLLADFDTNYKVSPPLREKTDRDALIKGLKDGTIGVISSGHRPHDDESKQLEFDLADFGIVNLQTFAANLVALSEAVPMEDLIDKVTVNPRQVVGLPSPLLEEGQMANLTLLDPKHKWTLDAGTNLSKAKNSPWYGQQVKGRTVAVFNNGKSIIHA
ncbi:MAG: dihydroorotase [Cyclobacteriaceae bacterium]|jgi:dihydroorotase|nr:dihydroorotase [Cytophagales bacterium]HNP76594.1 dihydroorotase [Cyclobacteriaceae bacterium]